MVHALGDVDEDRWRQVGEAIRRERKGRASQAELALAVGVTQPMISDWEKGKEKRPSLQHLYAIERFLDLPRGHFLRIAGYVDDPCQRTTEDAIRADTSLAVAYRDNLILAYRAFVAATKEEQSR